MWFVDYVIVPIAVSVLLFHFVVRPFTDRRLQRAQTMKMRIKPKAEKVEPTIFRWEAAMPRTSDPTTTHVMYDVLTYKDMVLGCVEAFDEDGPWYGNIGNGVTCYRRTGAMNSLEMCRKEVEKFVVLELQVLMVKLSDAKLLLRQANAETKTQIPKGE